MPVILASLMKFSELPRFPHEVTIFPESGLILVTKKKYSYSSPVKRDNCALSFSGFITLEVTNPLTLTHVFIFVKSSAVSLSSSPLTNNIDGYYYFAYTCTYFSLTERIHFGIILFRLPIVLLPLEGWRAAWFN